MRSLERTTHYAEGCPPGLPAPFSAHADPGCTAAAGGVPGEPGVGHAEADAELGVEVSARDRPRRKGRLRGRPACPGLGLRGAGRVLSTRVLSGGAAHGHERSEGVEPAVGGPVSVDGEGEGAVAAPGGGPGRHDPTPRQGLGEPVGRDAVDGERGDDPFVRTVSVAAGRNVPVDDVGVYPAAYRLRSGLGRECRIEFDGRDRLVADQSGQQWGAPRGPSGLPHAVAHPRLTRPEVPPAAVPIGPEGRRRSGANDRRRHHGADPPNDRGRRRQAQDGMRERAVATAPECNPPRRPRHTPSSPAPSTHLAAPQEESREYPGRDTQP